MYGVEKRCASRAFLLFVRCRFAVGQWCVLKGQAGLTAPLHCCPRIFVNCYFFASARRSIIDT
jgi:hypothetical protein